MQTEHKKIGDLLLEKGLISQDELTEALTYQKKTGKQFGETLLQLGYIKEDDLLKALSEQMNVPYAQLDSYLIDPHVVTELPEKLARELKALPIFKIENRLTVAMVDPLDIAVIDKLQKDTGCEIEPIVCLEDGLLKMIDKYYSGVPSEMKQLSEKIVTEDLKIVETQTEEKDESIKMAEEAPIVKLVNMIILQAIKERATDIHIEPEKGYMRVRYRVDGEMYEVMTTPAKLQPAVVSRIKIMSNLDIAERRVPQDGRFTIELESKQVDFRVSILPLISGEKVVMRLLDKSTALFRLDQLGFSKENKANMEELIQRPHGIILVTGPTGSGKTTTLYSALNIINTLDKNIMTVEDPVEYEFEIINQVQVNPKTGMTFARALRAFLRQDPDVILVGEIRDLETAEIAIQAALTGHLVFSTLHTNSAPESIIRLVDMGVEPFLISSAVIGILAQRLVRRICPSCKQPYTPSEGLLKQLSCELNDVPNQFFIGNGCRNCNNRGYKGRSGIHELLIPNDEIKDMVMKRASGFELQKKAQQAGMKTLYQDGLEKVSNGITTIDEVLAVTREV
ncbi:MAG: type IV-A pilus assembly ATPase PilB [Elusimicrobiota bacterium]